MMPFKVYKTSTKCSDPRGSVQFLTIRVDKNIAILVQPEFLFLAIRVDGNAAILKQPDTFEIKCINFTF